MIEGCYGYRLLFQIDEIFHSLNAELTAVVVYLEQLSLLFTPSQSRPQAKTGSVLYRICGIARADSESVDASLKGSTGERSERSLGEIRS